MKQKSIRTATAEDAELIFNFIRELAIFEKLEHEVVSNADILRKNLFCENPVAEVLIAELDDQAVGFALFFKNFSTFLGAPGMYLEDLFVLEKYRGNGIGELLMRELFKICQQRNYQRMEWSVLDWNAKAIQFYESLGAEILPDWRKCRAVKFDF